MIISLAIEKMINFYQGNIHDINHFLKVYGFAKTIGEQENLDANTQEKLELAAVIHDIACPLCREKYGSTNGKLQEQESPALVEQFLFELSVPEETISCISWVVAHHHTLPERCDMPEGWNLTDMDRMVHQILLEADYLVNADEGGKSKEGISSALTKLFHTRSGKQLLRSVYRIP